MQNQQDKPTNNLNHLNCLQNDILNTGMIKIGSPLFILREKCQEDLFAVLYKLAEIGFDGVEFLGFFDRQPKEIRRVLERCGITAVGDHVHFKEFSEETDRVISEHKEIGCTFITISGLQSEGKPGGEQYAQTIKTIERIGESMNRAGLTLLYHNHADELRSLEDGRTILEHLMDDISPELLALEPDLGWMSIAGADPAHYLHKYNSRCPVVHFKDYIPSENGYLFRPTGYGVMNNAELYAITQSHNPQPQWYVMDHDDAYGRDIYQDLSISMDYFRNLALY